MNPIFKTGLRLATASVLTSVLASVAYAAETAAEAGAEHGGGAKMPQLDFSTYSSQVFWLIITFAVLFILMWKVAIPRVGEVIEAREQKIRADLERAEQLRAEIATTEAAVEEALANARSEAQDVVRKAMDKIAADHAKKQAKLDEELAAKVIEAENSINDARKEALASVREVAQDVASASVEKLTGKAATAKEISSALDAVTKGA